MVKKASAASAARLKEAQVLQHAGKLQEARSIYQEVVRLEPDNVQALYLTGMLANDIRSYAIAETMLSRALQLNPDFPDGHIALAQLFENQKRYEEAEAHYKLAIKVSPDDGQLQHSYAKMLYDSGRYTEAAGLFRTIIEKWPTLSGSWHMLGSSLYTLGDFEGARAAFRETLRLSPESGMTHWNLSNLITYHEDDPHLEQMEAAMLHGNLILPQRIELHFALAKAYHDVKRYDLAFPHYEEGARLQRKTYQYSIDSDVKEFAETRHTFAHALPAIDLSQGCLDDTPIFILGMPRSGTTLIEQILASHPDVAGAGETPLFFETLRRAGETTGDKTALHLTSMSPGLREELGAYYIRELRKRAPKGIKHITDKMPGNFRIVGFIAMILPRARIIHCTRDAIDTCLSIFRSHFTHTHPYACDLAELGEYYCLYRELMDFWNASFPGHIYEANYETLLADFEPGVRKLLKACGLSWNEKCLQFHATKRNVTSASGTQVRSPLYHSSIGNWKHYAPYVGALKKALGGYANN